MSDQPSPTPKPKPGSLRDRIAAFEKSAGTSAPAPAQPPPLRPKPAGFATWKPKQISPPSSPAASSKELASGPTSGLSASDARESITKAGSLKDRMAALQNKGAFGASPPVAPKPAVDKPKWKPPPVVRATVDEDDTTSNEVSGGGIISAIEKAISPPLSDTYEEKKEGEVNLDEAEKSSTAVGGVDNGEDPEEAERQRRSAIAARMARLGGARLGMAPPVVGKKPLRRRSTQEEQQQATDDTKPAEEQPTQAPVTSQQIEEQTLSSTDQGKLPYIFPFENVQFD